MSDLYPLDREKLYLEQAEDLQVPPEAIAANDVLSAYNEICEFAKMKMRGTANDEAQRFRRRKLREQLGSLDETVQVLKRFLAQHAAAAHD